MQIGVFRERMAKPTGRTKRLPAVLRNKGSTQATAHMIAVFAR